MKNTLLILLELLICAMPVMANAQVGEKEDVTVSGIVTSAEDGAPLIGVVVMSSAGGGVSASDDGSYSISVPAGTLLTFYNQQNESYFMSKRNAKYSFKTKRQKYSTRQVKRRSTRDKIRIERLI